MLRADTIYISVADFNIKITFEKSYFPVVQELFKKRFISRYKGFITSKPKKKRVDFSITIQDVIEIDLLHTKTSQQKRYIALYRLEKNTAITFYYINLVQFRIILREILQMLLTENEGFQLHSSGIIVHEKAVLFVGKHGAGKSTAAKLAQHRFPTLADDSIAIRKHGSAYYAYQTFDHEKNYIPKSSKGYEVKDVYFIYQSAYFSKERIKKKADILHLLTKECWVIDKKMLSQQYKTINECITKNTFFFKLFFAKRKSGFTHIIES